MKKCTYLIFALTAILFTQCKENKQKQTAQNSNNQAKQIKETPPADLPSEPKNSKEISQANHKNETTQSLSFFLTMKNKEMLSKSFLEEELKHSVEYFEEGTVQKEVSSGLS